jgi:hypothetical protein
MLFRMAEQTGSWSLNGSMDRNGVDDGNVDLDDDEEEL